MFLAFCVRVVTPQADKSDFFRERDFVLSTYHVSKYAAAGFFVLIYLAFKQTVLRIIEIILKQKKQAAEENILRPV